MDVELEVCICSVGAAQQSLLRACLKIDKSRLVG
jgi:hypothetical protein